MLLSGKSRDILPFDAPYYDASGKEVVAKRGDGLPNGHVMFVSDTVPSPDLAFSLMRRRGTVAAKDWAELVAAYDSRCAVCGQHSSKLEKGHMDPAKPMELENIIPMCSDCNNWASSDLVFDRTGRITALASPRFVRSASVRVKLLIKAELNSDRTLATGQDGL